MSTTLFASEFMMLLIAGIAAIAFWDLFRTKDGWLRIIIMGYMLAEIIVYLGAAIYFWLQYNGYSHMSIETFRLIILPSKVVAMIALMIWIRKNEGL